jgi:hypothetical protein
MGKADLDPKVLAKMHARLGRQMMAMQVQIRWDDPRVLEKGREWRRQAQYLADEFNHYGADATRLLGNYGDLPQGKDQVCVPAMLADAIMSVLLSLPRAEHGRRPKPSTLIAKRLVEAGFPKRMSARLAARLAYGETREQIRRRFRSSGPKLGKRPKPRK